MTGNASQVHVASPRSWNVLLDDDIKAFPDISLLGFSIPGVSGALEPGKWLSSSRHRGRQRVPHQGEQRRGRKASLNYHSVIPVQGKARRK